MARIAETSRLLGIPRNSLRAKLKRYFLTGDEGLKERADAGRLSYLASPIKTHAAQTWDGACRSRERRRASVKASSLRNPASPALPLR